MSDANPSDTSSALRSGIRAEVVTVAWMVLEAVVAVYAGLIAHSLLLMAFGIDSVIELLSGAVLLWRLTAKTANARVESIAAWLSGSLLVLLCVYIVISSAIGLSKHEAPERSSIGIAISAAAGIFMPLLAAWKRRVNAVLQSAALRADIVETLACAYMAAFVLVGLILNATIRWWWTDDVLSLGLLFWLGHEAKEAFEAARDEHS